MWYHPGAFALDWRDVVAAWIVCFAVTVALIGQCALGAEDEFGCRAAAVRPAHAAPVHAQSSTPAHPNFSARARINGYGAGSTARHVS